MLAVENPFLPPVTEFFVRARATHLKRVVSEPPIGQLGQNRRLHCGDNLAGLRANHREAENAVVAPADQRLHEALCFVRRIREMNPSNPLECAHRASVVQSRFACRVPA